MARKPSQNERIPITLRLDSDIHKALKLISAIEMRSLNTQIEYFLRESVIRYENETSYYDDSLQKVIQEITSGMSKKSPSEADDPDRS